MIHHLTGRPYGRLHHSVNQSEYQGEHGNAETKYEGSKKGIKVDRFGAQDMLEDAGRDTAECGKPGNALRHGDQLGT